MDRCSGLTGGINLHIARTKVSGRRATCRDHKRRNCLKLQALSLVDGFIFNLFDPVEVLCHDMTLFRGSNIANTLLIVSRQFYIYGDPAHVLQAFWK